MTSGGARARSGFPPDPQALARNRPSDQVTWTHLPASREGDPPPWPLAYPTIREKALWATEWRRPQAVMWERNGQEIEVANYIRCLRRAEGHKSTPAHWGLVVRQQTELGINIGGLLRNRWIIDPPSGDAQASGAEVPVEETSARDRLKLVAS
jgi:hypothetical protein